MISETPAKLPMPSPFRPWPYGGNSGAYCQIFGKRVACLGSIIHPGPGTVACGQHDDLLVGGDQCQPRGGGGLVLAKGHQLCRGGIDGRRGGGGRRRGAAEQKFLQCGRCDAIRRVLTVPLENQLCIYWI